MVKESVKGLKRKEDKHELSYSQIIKENQEHVHNTLGIPNIDKEVGSNEKTCSTQKTKNR